MTWLTKLKCLLNLHKYKTIFQKGNKIVKKCIHCSKEISSIYDMSNGSTDWVSGNLWKEDDNLKSTKVLPLAMQFSENGLYHLIDPRGVGFVDYAGEIHDGFISPEEILCMCDGAVNVDVEEY